MNTNKTRLRVGVLFGGRSAEHEISVLSARNVIERLLREAGLPVARFRTVRHHEYVHYQQLVLHVFEAQRSRCIQSCGPQAAYRRRSWSRGSSSLPSSAIRFVRACGPFPACVQLASAFRGRKSSGRQESSFCQIPVRRPVQGRGSANCVSERSVTNV